MDRRSFLKSAAAAAAAIPALPALAAAPAALPSAIDANLGTIFSGTITGEQIAAGAVTAEKISVIHYARGVRVFKDGICRVTMGGFDEDDDLGAVRLVIHEGEAPHAG